MVHTYRCFKSAASAPRVVTGFINNATGLRAAMDTAMSLEWDDTDFIVRAVCSCGEEGVNMADRLVVHFDPVGRESDLLSVAAAPDGSVTCRQLGMAFAFTEPTWSPEPYAFPARVETVLRNDGWSVTLRIPLLAMFALRGGKAPESFRLNVARVFANREWSYWPLADGTWGEFVPAFGIVHLIPQMQDEAPAALTMVEPLPAPAERDRTRLKPLVFRGVMYDTSRGAFAYDAETYAKFVDWLTVCGCTHFMLYFEDGFRYRSHPEFATREALVADDLKRIEAACRERGLELILAQTTFGHMPGVLKHPATVRMAENGNPYQICPSHPDTYPFLSDLLDELIPQSHSAYFMVNCDESRWIGQCPKCRRVAPDAKGKEDLYLKHLLWLHRKVASHGRRMMMFGDHLERMPAILDRLPKDVVVADWQYFNWVRYPTLSFYREHGLDVIGCPMGPHCVGYSGGRYDNIRRFTEESMRCGAQGVLDTIWESRVQHLGLHCPSTFLACRIAQGQAPRTDEEIFAEMEETIWPGHPPRIPWKALASDRCPADPRLLAKIKADTAAAIRRAVPDPRFAWIADSMRLDLETSREEKIHT